MWKILTYSVISLHLASAINMHHFMSNRSGTNFFNHITQCIENIGHLQLKFRPTIIIDTVNVKDKTKGNAFTKRVVNRVTKNKIPTIIITNGTNSRHLNDDLVIHKKYTMHALNVVYFDMCNAVTTYNFTEIDKEMKHLILISDEDTNNCVDDLRGIKNSVSQHDITFIIQDNNENKYKIFTFIPKIDRNTCKEVVERPIHINTCKNGTLLNNKVFPIKKPTNLNKCVLKVGMAALFPFSQIDNKDSLQTYDRINESIGSDMEIIKIIAEYFNASLDLYYIYRKEENPYVNSDFLDFVINGSLDMVAGGLYRMYGDEVAYSGLYARQAVLWIYAAERDEASWQNLLHDMYDLYMFFIFYMSYAVSWYIVSVFDGNAVTFQNTLLRGWGALFGGTSLQEARTVKQKILNIGHFVMRIYLSAYFSIHLYSFLTIKEPVKIYDTDDELMDSGRTPFLETSTKYFINDKRYLDFANTSVECVSFVDCTKKTLEKKGMTIVLQGNFYKFQSETAVDGEARIMRATEHILTVYNEIIIRKDNPLVVMFQQVIQNLFEAGITESLYSKAIGLVMMEKAESANRNMMMNSYSCQSGCAISFKQIDVIFYAWTFGCVVAYIVFTIEIGSDTKKKNVLIE